MPSTSTLLTLAAALSTANAAYQGFNYGATFTDGRVKEESDFEAEFKAAADLPGTDGGFTSGRLFTMRQGKTTNPIAAIPAAIKTKTSLLFGLWASAGDAEFNNEIGALQNTIDQYCGDLDGLVAGISVGSEDLYRISPTGIENDENPGVGPDVLTRYIERVRDTIKDSCLSDAPIGHVDTWTAYANSSNSALIEACDWIGMDAYPYFENTKPNGIARGADLFQAALDETQRAAGDKEVWITETGWPVSGKTERDAVASAGNAEEYYKAVGCPRFGSTNIWWYILRDSNTQSSNPSFGVLNSDLSGSPRYDLSCDDADRPATTSSSASAPSATTKSETSEVPESSASVPEVSSSADDETSAEPSPVPSDSPSDGSDATKPVPIPTGSVPTSDAGEPAAPEPSDEPEQPEQPEQPQPQPQPTPGQPERPTPGEPEATGTGGAGGNAPSEVPEAGSTKINSLGAAAVAMMLAVAMI